MTFLVVLLTGLYEPDTQTGEFTCMMHPMKKTAAAGKRYSELCGTDERSSGILQSGG